GPGAASRSGAATRISRGPSAEVPASVIAAARFVLRCMDLIPSVCRRDRISSAAGSFGATISVTRSALTAVQEDRPALDALRREHPVDPPRVGGEPLADRALGRRADDVQRLAVTFEWAAEQDEALVDEVVHELGVLVPAVLLTHVAAPVPRSAAFEPEDEGLH